MRRDCDKCGQGHVTNTGHPACVGHKRKTGAPCRAHPVGGTTLCSKHGGMTPVIRQKGIARQAEQQVERTLAQVAAGHYRPDEHPFETLVELGRRLAARERALDELAGEYRAVSHEANLQAALRLSNDTSRLSAQVGKTVLDANLDERMVRVEEIKSEVMLLALGSTFRRWGLSEQQCAEVVAVFSDELAAFFDGRRALPTLPQRLHRPAHMDRR